jgi:hypothetical protein
MNQSAVRSILGFSMGVLLAATGCGSSSSGGNGGGGSGGAGGGNVGNLTSCPKSDLKIVFNPMYSAFDGVHNFKIPAVVDGIDPEAITWSASDKSMVAIATDDSTGGAMITAQKAGTVTIIATAGSICGGSVLTITAATSDDWEAGSARYNDGVTINRVPRGNGGGTPDAAADAATPQQAACTNCHGDTATVLQYKTVQHTPEQAGGFSDAELRNIFMNGMVPTGGYFDTSIVSYQTWQSFHKWQMTDDEAKGIIVYLRSLAPTKQTGTGNFGGRVDGGIFDRPPREGGMGRRDGNGGGMNPDNGGGSGGSGGGSGGATGGDDAASDASAD